MSRSNFRRERSKQVAKILKDHLKDSDVVDIRLPKAIKFVEEVTEGKRGPRRVRRGY